MRLLGWKPVVVGPPAAPYGHSTPSIAIGGSASASSTDVHAPNAADDSFVGSPRYIPVPVPLDWDASGVDAVRVVGAGRAPAGRPTRSSSGRLPLKPLAGARVAAHTVPDVSPRVALGDEGAVGLRPHAGLVHRIGADGDVCAGLALAGGPCLGKQACA